MRRLKGPVTAATFEETSWKEMEVKQLGGAAINTGDSQAGRLLVPFPGLTASLPGFTPVSLAPPTALPRALTFWLTGNSKWSAGASAVAHCCCWC